MSEAACPGCGLSTSMPRCPKCDAARVAGRYVVESVLHQGPAGRVYVARGDDGTQVALKELVFRLVPGAAELEAFEREVLLLRQIRHPRIPRLLDSFHEGDGPDLCLYLVTELVLGTSLETDVASGPLAEADVVAIARDLLSILSDLHSLSPKVLHRDVKPANLVRGEADGRIWLVDFGAARDLRLGVTAGTTMVGTYGYMAPEQLGGVASERSDLYAAGATLLHLATGRPPTETIRFGTRVDLARAKVPTQLRPLLAALLEEDPARRPASAEAAALLLDASTSRINALVGIGAVLIAIAVALVVRTTPARRVDGRHTLDSPAIAATPNPRASEKAAPRPPPTRYPSDVRIPAGRRFTRVESGKPDQEVRCDSPESAFYLEAFSLDRRVPAHFGGDGREQDRVGLSIAFVNASAEPFCRCPHFRLQSEAGNDLNPDTSELPNARAHETARVAPTYLVPAGTERVFLIVQDETSRLDRETAVILDLIQGKATATLRKRPK